MAITLDWMKELEYNFCMYFQSGSRTSNFDGGKSSKLSNMGKNRSPLFAIWKVGFLGH